MRSVKQVECFGESKWPEPERGDGGVGDDRARLALEMAIGTMSLNAIPRAIATEVARALVRRQAESYALGFQDARERDVAWLTERAAKLREDAKTIPLGARSGRRTFLKDCPAHDVESFVAGIIEEQAASVRALTPEKER